MHVHILASVCTCLNDDGVAQTSLVAVPGRLNVGAVLKSPGMVLRILFLLELLALQCDCVRSMQSFSPTALASETWHPR